MTEKRLNLNQNFYTDSDHQSFRCEMKKKKRNKKNESEEDKETAES